MSAFSPLIRRTPSEAAGRLQTPARKSSASNFRGRSAHSYPHATTIETGLDTRLPGTWKVDPEACQQKGVPGFTNGLVTTFASATPDFQVAAHEAVHKLQHAGLTRDHGLGAEGHANAVANELSAGRPGGRLIDRSRGSAVPVAERRYTAFNMYHPGKKELWPGAIGERGAIPVTTKGSAIEQLEFPLRVSDTFETLTNTDGSRHSHVLFAAETLLAEGNKALAAQGSGVKLLSEPGQQIEINGRKLVSVKLQVEGQSGDAPKLCRQCNEAAWQVMGPGKPAPVARFAGSQQTRASAYPNKYQEDILADRSGGGPTSLEEYKNAARPEEMDHQLGINRHASPGVGEAYVINPAPQNRARWNYHWAAVVLTPGADRVTLENAAGPVMADPNGDWAFQTYGSATKPGQTFHDEFSASGFAGARSEGAMTMVAQHPDFTGLSLSELLLRYNDKSGRWGRWPFRELERRATELRMTVADFIGDALRRLRM